MTIATLFFFCTEHFCIEGIYQNPDICEHIEPDIAYCPQAYFEVKSFLDTATIDGTVGPLNASCEIGAVMINGVVNPPRSYVSEPLNWTTILYNISSA